jgi:hypothetical protein
LGTGGDAKNRAALAVRDAVSAAFSDTWLFQHGMTPRQTAERSCRYARELLDRAFIDDPSVRSRLNMILGGCEAVMNAIRNQRANCRHAQ